MATTGMQLLGLIMSLIGWVCGFLVCVLPMWRVTAFIGNKHSDGADHVGRPVDELHRAEYRRDPVQGV
ncbi:Claudin-6 [Bagarius yarrelli]|uniref:Claudin-6 n=1 Tax=Bagarius yarrelli TaxID=175774 RepID=A0A556V8V8_BAGYA|nr:Claudin-6 [Bagarius yarrelli]